METPTERFWGYLEPTLQGIENVVYVQLSDGDRIDRLLADSQSQDVYPGVFVIRPKYGGMNENSGTLWHIFYTTAYVLVKASLSSYEDQDEAYAQAEVIATKMSNKIFQDSLESKVYFDFNSYTAEPVEYLTTDAAWGYEIKFKFGLPVNDLYYP